MPALISGFLFALCGYSHAAPTKDSTLPAKATEVTLAQSGKSLLPIVLSANASEETKAVAADVQKYLNQITGANFEVKPGDGTSGIVLGTLEQFPQPELQEPLEMRGPYDGLEAYAIRSEKDRVLLIGRSEKGAAYAAHRFLELLGVRWFFPAEEWEVVPKQSTLTFAHSETSRPEILARRIWFAYGSFLDPGKTQQQSRPYLEYELWKKRNRLGESVQVYAGHAWQTIIRNNAEVFDNNPEYLALVNGKRQTRAVVGEGYPEVVQFCVSEPAVRRMAVEWGLNYFKENPKADMVSVDPSDTPNHCECDECKKLGSVPDRVFGLANEVARAVQKAYPGKMVGLYAYSAHTEPPSFKLEPNVFVQLTHGFNRGQYSFEELVDLWPKKADHMGYYEYFSVWQWDWDMPPGGHGANVDYIRNQIRLYAKKNAMAFDAESSNNWGLHGRGYYVASKLLWNPQTDVEAVLEDFYDKAFGPAAMVMQRYYERLDPANKPRKSAGLYGSALRDLQEASTLAKDRPDVLARLRHLKQYMRYVQLRWMFDKVPAAEKEKRRELALEILKHVYRTRYSYMNHWRAMEWSWSGNIGAEVGEPQWWVSDPSPKPWTEAEPYTEAQVEALFQEGLQYFPATTEVEEKEFSRELVLVRSPELPAYETSQHSQHAVRYAVHGSPQSPVRLTVLTATTKATDKPAAKYTLRDAGGAVLHEDRLPQDMQTHEIKLEVPRNAVYFFEYDDHGAGWKIDFPADQPYGMLTPSERYHFYISYAMPMFFYVPKGTRELHFFAGPGVPFELRRPDGTVERTVPAEGGTFKIPIPTGMDGDLWSFKGSVLYDIHLHNAPNIFSASPRALLIPRDVAEKDKLEFER